MLSKKLRSDLFVSLSLSLPIATVTGTNLVYGRKRKGKTYKGKVIAEEMLKQRQQIVVIDPTDVWWGLQSSADGKSAGYPITVFGGRHANLPLDAGAAEDLADAVADDDFSAIFSLKGMTRANEQRFCYGFLERLYRRNPQKPLHIFMDEADIYAPQTPFGEEARTLGATQNMVRRGGVDGLGMTLITQRPAVLSKSVSSQCDTLISVALNDPRDLDSVKDWVLANYEDRELAKKLIVDIPTLGRPGNKGIAWVLSPDRDISARVEFRELRTFDSGATPKVGEKRRTPRVLSQVDLEKLGKTIADAAQRAKESDPKELKSSVAKLRSENQALAKKLEVALAKPAKAAPVAREKIVKREVKVVSAKQLARIEHAITKGDALITRWDDVSANAFGAQDGVRKQITDALNAMGIELGTMRAEIAKTRAPMPVAPAAQASRATAQVAKQQIRAPGTVPRTAPEQTGGLPIGEAATLRALIQYPAGLEKRQLTTLTGYKRSTRDSYIARLKVRGFIEESGARVMATAAGIAHLPDAEPLPTGSALRDWWLARLPAGEGVILNVLIENYPNAVKKDDLTETTGYKRSTRDSYLTRLGAKELVVDVARGEAMASASLFDPEPSRPVNRKTGKSNGVHARA